MSDFLDQALADKANQQEQEQGPSVDELLDQSVQALEHHSIRSTLRFIDGVNAGFDVVWNNEYGLTPEQVVERLGTNASAVFQRHAAVVQFLAGQSAETLKLVRLPPSEYTITHEPDGRVTLTKAT